MAIPRNPQNRPPRPGGVDASSRSALGRTGDPNRLSLDGFGDDVWEEAESPQDVPSPHPRAGTSRTSAASQDARTTDRKPSAPRQETTTARKKDNSRRRQSSPVEVAPLGEVDHVDGLEWRVDPNTGARFKALPKTEFIGSDGYSVSRIDNSVLPSNFSGDDLTRAADMFLPHLRIAPSREEIMALRAEQAAQKRAQDQEIRRQQGAEADADKEAERKLKELEEKIAKRKR